MSSSREASTAARLVAAIGAVLRETDCKAAADVAQGECLVHDGERSAVVVNP